jgi:fatty acid desaturase
MDRPSPGPRIADLDPESRRALARLHQVEPSRGARRIAAYLVLWGAGGALAHASSSLLVRIPAWALIGLCLHGLGDMMHMCGHGRVFGRGWVDRAAGFLCGLPVFISCSCYWACHRLHHRWLGTERDPDAPQRIPPGLRSRVLRVYLVVGFPIYAVRVAALGPIHAAGFGERAACLLETASMVAIYRALLGPGLSPWLVDGWLMALPFAMLVANLRGLAEHAFLERGTRTTLTPPIVSWFFNNQNHHVEHHLLPGLPWHALPAAHRILGPLYDGRTAVLGRGYGSLLAQMLGGKAAEPPYRL